MSDGDDVTGQDRLLIEQYIRERGLPAENLILIWSNVWPEMGYILENAGVKGIDELLDDGPLAYWKKMRHGTLSGILANREWLQQQRFGKILNEVQRTKDALDDVRKQLATRANPPQIGDLNNGGLILRPATLDKYLIGLAESLVLEYTNRLLMLSAIEHHIRLHDEGPSDSYYDFVDSLEKPASRGRSASYTKRRRRIKLALKLLDAEPQRGEPYRSVEDFYMDLEVQDADLNSVRAVRKFFREWLGRQFSSMEELRAMVPIWTCQIEIGIYKGLLPPNLKSSN